MLDSSALSQLKQLKQDIREANPIYQGTVKGTSKRFGFVIAEGGKGEFLLPQTEMNRLLPGDIVTFKLEKGQKKDDKPIAKVEKFISSPFDTFFGTVKSKNNNLFIQPQHKQVNRWIFIPPKFRQGLQEGDIVFAKISQHPFKADGRVQAKVLDRIGKPSDPFIDHKLAMVKFGIQERKWKPEEIEAIRQTAEQCLEDAIPNKADYRDKTFFTIDGANTQDLDDALSIEVTDSGWKLSVAIADVSTFVTPSSPLDKIAATQINTLYLPGQKVPMLPEILSSDICSLRSDVDRLAFICEMQVNTDGEITDTQYQEAVIQAKGKLSYDDVEAYLNDKSKTFSDTINAMLDELSKLTTARQQWREKNNAASDEYFDYRFQLDENGHIQSIEKHARNFAQKLVEECMIAANSTTADYLKAHNAKALYLAHNGFKLDQMPGIKKLLAEYFNEEDSDQLLSLDGYKAFLNQHKSNEYGLPLQDILRKKMHRSEWSVDPLPHFGLGLPVYTTFTSPIRKYSDLLIHRQLKSILRKEPVQLLTDSELVHLNTVSTSIRDAQKDCETALKADYIKQFEGKPLTGEVAAINHRFVTVFLSDFDLLGAIPVKTIDKKAKFKQESLQLVTEDITYKLKDTVTVFIDAVDKDERAIRLKLQAKEKPSPQEETTAA